MADVKIVSTDNGEKGPAVKSPNKTAEKIKEFVEIIKACEVLAKPIALLIAAYLFYLVFSDVKFMYTDLATINENTIRLYFVIVLVSYCIGGTKNAMRAAAVGIFLYLLPFSYAQITGKQAKENLFGSANYADTVNIAEEGSLNFKLGSFETNGKWLYVPDGLRYSTSTPGNSIVYIKYKNGGPMTKVDGYNVKVRKGAFKYVAGELPVNVTLLIVKNIIDEAKPPESGE